MTSEQFIAKLREYDAKGTVHLLNGVTVEGTVNLERDFYIKSLPDNLTVNGDLRIRWSNLQEIPENLVCKSLYAEKCKFETIPNSLQVRQTLNLTGSNVKKLPEILKCTHLHVERTMIEKLPENLDLSVLVVSESRVTKIPKSAKISYSLVACNLVNFEYPTHIKKLVWLDLEGTTLTNELPDGLVLESLILGGRDLIKLPENLTVLEVLPLK